MPGNTVDKAGILYRITDNLPVDNKQQQNNHGKPEPKEIDNSPSPRFFPDVSGEFIPGLSLRYHISIIKRIGFGNQ
jgi:hypothetical protein